MSKKKLFTIKELNALSAAEIIEKIKHENYSLLASLGAEKLRKEMVPVGKACHAAINYFLTAKTPEQIRAKIVKTFKKLAPATYDKTKIPHDTPDGLVIGFNHPSLGEILRIVLMKVDLMGDKPMLFPVNLPWYEAIAPDFDKLMQLGIIITPTITPSTWKKLGLAEENPFFDPANRLKRDFRNIYTDASIKTVKDGGIIFVAPSATRQATVFKSKAVYDKAEDIIPTMSVLALKLYADPKMNCGFLPIAVLPPQDYKRGLNIGKPYQLLPAKLMTAADIRAKYFTEPKPKRLDGFDYDFHLQIAQQLPKNFWY